MEIKLVLFFDTATTNGWWGNLEALRAAERGKGVDLERLLYIIRLWAFLLLCLLGKETTITTCYV